MPPRDFPVKTALAVASCVVALAAYHRFRDPSKGLSPAIFAEAARLTLIRHNPAFIARKPAPGPLNGIQTPQPPTARPKLPPISPYLIDDDGTLDPFFSALHSLETGGPSTHQVVTVLHYGDSPTTADLITGDVRALLQQRFGDAGTGFLLAGKPWAWYGHRGVDLSDKGWDISTAVGKGRADVYGIGGASFTGDSGASTHITLKDPMGPAATAPAAMPPASAAQPQTTQPSRAVLAAPVFPAVIPTMEISFLAAPNAGSLAIKANSLPLESTPTAAEAQPHPAWQTVPLPPGTKTIDLKPAAGSVTLFGETLLSGRSGVLYDSLGLNGASTTVLSNGFNAAAWAAELQHEHPALVIINYGTNESGFGSFVDKGYEPVLRTAIARIRAALPGQPILIMSPMDRGRRSGVDQIDTFDTIPRIVAIQQRVAAEQNCAFFDTFNAMGGDGTMSRWYTGHPRLVAGDLIHPTPQGASIVAQLFVKDLSLGYDRFLRRQPGYHPPLPPTQSAANPDHQQTPGGSTPTAQTISPASTPPPRPGPESKDARHP